MSDWKYKSAFYKLVFNEIMLAKYFETSPTIILENGII